MNTRRNKILNGLALSQLLGVEIGPLDKPLVEKRDGRVIYIDHSDAEKLRLAYAKDASVNVSKISVDAIWGDQTLRQVIDRYGEAMGSADGSLFVDYVVASHVIEHVPDMITWFQEIRSILNSSGEVRLAIPDRRFTFDFLRRPTNLTDVLAAYSARSRIPNTQCLIDYYTNVAIPVDVVAAWQGKVTSDSLQDKRFHTVEQSLVIVRDALQNATYQDVHCWVFTPASFATLCADLAVNDLLDFTCHEFHDTAENDLEFIVHLRVSDDKAEKVSTWRKMAALAHEHRPT